MINQVLVTGFIIGTLTTPFIVQSATLPSIHHSLKVELIPATNVLTATDAIDLPQNLLQHTPLTFALNPHLTIDHVELNGQPVSVSKHTENHSNQPLSTHWVIEYPSSALRPEEILSNLTITYHGRIDDSPTASGGLRFVRPDNTNGHIGSEGIYLTSETFWYPTWEHHLVTFDLSITLPVDWQAITQGREIDQFVTKTARISHWDIASPAEALTVAANQYVVQKNQWGDIQLATYLLKDEAALSPLYLEATEKYLELYTHLLGPYPFSQFAVAENFFPSGLGMPSFTLLGQRIVQRGYTQPYSLGHEIVHSWLGNSVFNDFAKGNWVEGLTTYLANYYYDEATGNHAAAVKTRRRMMVEYNLYATPENDYPIRQFHHKEARIDNAVGYQKTALFFHMLRQELGDAAFFAGIRQIVQEGTGSYIEWEDLIRIFSTVGKQNMAGFFKQWIDSPGAPSLTLNELSVKQDSSRMGKNLVTGIISQRNPAYKLALPIQVSLQGEDSFHTTINLNQKNQPFALRVPGMPTSITIDPDRHWLLHLQREQMAPMLNVWDTDTHRIFIQAKANSKEEETSFKGLLQRIQGQPNIEIRQADSPNLTAPASYLIIGTPARQLLESKNLSSCPSHVQANTENIGIFNQSFAEPNMAFLITCTHPAYSHHTVSLFFGLSPQAVTPVARLLFFYGWDSYLVFQQGKVVARGMFQPVHSARDFSIPAP